MADRTPADALREQYRRLSDEELVDRVATGETEYTEVAWAVLQEEVSRRHLVAKTETADTSSGTPATGHGMEQWEKHLSTRKAIFVVIGGVGLLIALWRMASGDIEGAVFGAGIGLYFWYNVLLKQRGLSGK